MKYLEKIKDPRWQKKRLEVLERDDWQCQKCGDKETTLHVHHLRYIPNKAPWEYKNYNLLTLCSNCHEYETEIRKECESQLLDMLRAKQFLADDVLCIQDFLFSASNLYHPQHLSDALRWNLCNSIGVERGYYLLEQLIKNFEYQGKFDG